MKTTFYGLEILHSDRIMTKVYGKLKKQKCESLTAVNIFEVFYFLFFFKIAGFRRDCHIYIYML